MKNQLLPFARASLRKSLVLALLLPGLLPLGLQASPSSGNSTQPEQQSTNSAKLRGQVVDAQSGEAIIGASITVKGNRHLGTVTDVQGRYSLAAAPGSVLVISCIGYQTIEVSATSGSQTIKLKENARTLGELVVVGYTTQRKESLTGAMISLKDSKLKDLTTPSVANLLNGKAPGVYVAPG